MFSQIIKFLGLFLSGALILKIVPLIGTLLLLFYTGYVGWVSLAPQKPVPNEARQKIADQAIQNVIEDIRNKRGELRNVALLHFYNDPTDYFSDSLRNALNGSGILNLTDRTFEERANKFLNARCPEYDSAENALKAISEIDVQGVLWGKIDVYESSRTGAVLHGEWFLNEKQTGKQIASGVISEDSTVAEKKKPQHEAHEKNEQNVRAVSSFAPWYIRGLGFVLLFLLLPIVTIQFIRTMVAKRSNKVNAFMLSIYTVIDAIFAFFMIGCTFSSFMPVLFFVIALAVAFAYNVKIMSFALKLEEH